APVPPTPAEAEVHRWTPIIGVRIRIRIRVIAVGRRRGIAGSVRIAGARANLPRTHVVILLGSVLERLLRIVERQRGLRSEGQRCLGPDDSRAAARQQYADRRYHQAGCRSNTGAHSAVHTCADRRSGGGGGADGESIASVGSVALTIDESGLHLHLTSVRELNLA